MSTPLPYDELPKTEHVIQLTNHHSPGCASSYNIDLASVFRFYQTQHINVIPAGCSWREIKGTWSYSIPQAEAAKTELAATQAELAAAKAEIEALKAQLAAATEPKKGLASPSLERLRCSTQ